ncbi:TetR/AcrR family transcriptional regulator [Variovorax terrae]|uniref:CerR family C-terminal domain-containing protein n=1 Tax=Variovorax terrae TaxID=2923278 RepID=A0A9X2AMT8_9BURK|nr:TetR/AcrR family transcriptional regulator [Variovorax terrae]MCJ0761602.1 CerR family C-terminal domain-containing protein [Variovorax terrae]
MPPKKPQPKPEAAKLIPVAPPPRRIPVGRSAQREPQPDRRTNILLAAEKLFALRGFHAVSIRDIASEASVPIALVGYYYGAKHELYHAIFESWSPAIAARLEALRTVSSDPDPHSRLKRILDAFVSPLVALHQHPEGQYYALMAARDLAAPTPEADRAHHEFFDPLANAFIDALMTTVPQASRGRVAWCYQFMLGALLHFLTDQRVERLSNGENRASDPAAKEELLAFIAGGFHAVLDKPSAQAPVPHRPARRGASRG